MSFWKTAGIAVVGTSHIKREEQCQDVVASFTKNGMSVIALADGAGSAKHSLEGATIVVNAICKYMSNNFIKIFKDEDVLEIKKEILEDILHRLNKRAKRLKCDVKELSSTLIFVVVKEDSQCIIGHIGDGCVVTKDNKGWKITSLENKNSAVNETEFVTSRNVFATMRMYKGQLDGITSFAIMSDGSENALINKKDPENIKVTNAIKVMSDWMKTTSTTAFHEAVKNAFEKQITKVSNDDCSIAYLTKVKIETTYEDLDYDQKHDIFDKHYSHLYNAEAAIEDASYIIKVLQTTNATPQYVSKKSKVKLAACKKILDILYKANYLTLEDDIYSLISKLDLVTEEETVE